MKGVLLAGYTVFIGIVTLSPTPVDRPASGFLQRLNEWMPGSYAVLEFTANVALFVPLGVLVALLLPRRARWLAIVAGAALSLTIEVLQAVLLPERFATPADVVANTIGTAVGVLLVLIRSRARRPRSA